MNDERQQPETGLFARSSPDRGRRVGRGRIWPSRGAPPRRPHTGPGDLGPWQALARLVRYLILLGISFFGFLWILGDDTRQDWHDKVARTYVVYAWDARPVETFVS